MHVPAMGEVVRAVVETTQEDHGDRSPQLCVQLIDGPGRHLGTTAVAEQDHRDTAARPVSGKLQLGGDLRPDCPVVEGSVPPIGGDEGLHDVVEEQEKPGSTT